MACCEGSEKQWEKVHRLSMSTETQIIALIRSVFRG